MSQNTSAATDVGEFITDLDGGTFEHMLSVALSQTAAAVTDHDKVGKVTITLDVERVPGTHQVRIGHTLKYTKPTSLGKTSDEASSFTVMHVGKYGALSVAQASLMDNEKKQTRIPGA